VAVGVGGVDVIVDVGGFVGVRVGARVGVGDRDGLGVGLGFSTGVLGDGVGVDVGGTLLVPAWIRPGRVRIERAVMVTRAKTAISPSPFHHRFTDGFIVCLWSLQ